MFFSNLYLYNTVLFCVNKDISINYPTSNSQILFEPRKYLTAGSANNNSSRCGSPPNSIHLNTFLTINFHLLAVLSLTPPSLV